MDTPHKKIVKWAMNPKMLRRDWEDARDAVGDLVHDRSAREIAWRQAKKQCGRTVEDIMDNWRNSLR